MKLKQSITAGVASAGALFNSATAVVAQGNPGTVNFNAQQAGFNITDLGSLMQGILNMVLVIAALLVFFYMIWGGIQWITSGGDKGKTEEARNKITAAIIGLAVLAASYALFRVVLYFLGISNPLSSGFNIPTAY